MPKCLKQYADPSKARTYRNRQRARNYASTTMYPPKGQWSNYEDSLILEHATTDRELSAKIQRSVRAIQIRRCRLKKGAGNE